MINEQQQEHQLQTNKNKLDRGTENENGITQQDFENFLREKNIQVNSANNEHLFETFLLFQKFLNCMISTTGIQTPSQVSTTRELPLHTQTLPQKTEPEAVEQIKTHTSFMITKENQEKEENEIDKKDYNSTQNNDNILKSQEVTKERFLNHDDIPITPSTINFVELVEKNLAELNYEPQKKDRENSCEPKFKYKKPERRDPKKKRRTFAPDNERQEKIATKMKKGTVKTTRSQSKGRNKEIIYSNSSKKLPNTLEVLSYFSTEKEKAKKELANRSEDENNNLKRIVTHEKKADNTNNNDKEKNESNINKKANLSSPKNENKRNPIAIQTVPEEEKENLVMTKDGKNENENMEKIENIPIRATFGDKIKNTISHNTSNEEVIYNNSEDEGNVEEDNEDFKHNNVINPKPALKKSFTHTSSNIKFDQKIQEKPKNYTALNTQNNAQVLFENEMKQFQQEKKEFEALKNEYIVMRKNLNKEIEDFNAMKMKEISKIEKWKNEEIKKMKAQQNHYSKNEALNMQKMNQNKKDKELIEQLKAQLAKAQEEIKMKENQSKKNIEKLKKQLLDANNQISDLVRVSRKTLLKPKEIMKSNNLVISPSNAMSKKNQNNIKTVFKSPCQKDETKSSRPNLKIEISKNEFTSAFKESETYDIKFPKKYDLPSSIISEEKAKDGKTIRTYSNKAKEIIFASGVRKQTFEDGYQIIFFNNKDIKQTYPNGVIVYYFYDSKTVQTTFPDQLHVYKLKNGTIEKHYPTGRKEIIEPGGGIKIISPSGSTLNQKLRNGSEKKDNDKDKDKDKESNKDKNKVFVVNSREDGVREIKYADGGEIFEFSEGNQD